MRSVAIFNNKGGVGKTTLLCNLAGFLASERNKRVLVIDADPQCNATQNFFSEEQVEEFYKTRSGAFTIYSVIKPLASGRGYSEQIKTVKSNSFGVDVIIGDPRLSLTEDLLARDWSDAISGSARGLRTSLLFKHLLSLCGRYDYVIFDMGPSLGSINRAVLISADFFVTPMSIDIFSLKAIENISTSLEKWRKDLEIGLGRMEDSDELGIEPGEWSLRFAGYVTQQYTAKRDVDGTRRPVRAFDRILRRVPALINKEFIRKFQNQFEDVNYNLGSIPTLHSLIPLSQTSRRPIFALRAADGVVGAHFTKVREYKTIIKGIAQQLEGNLDLLA